MIGKLTGLARRSWLVAAFAILFPVAAGQAQPEDRPDRKILHIGWLLAVPGEAPLKRHSLLVENDTITAIRSGYVSPDAVGWRSDNVEVIDLRDMHAFPGLVDLHVHLTNLVAPGGALRTVTHDRAELALIGAQNAKTTLKAGVTTVLDLGTGRRAHEAAIYALREAVTAGKVPGPRIFAVGSAVSATGSSRTGLYRDAVEAAVGPEAVCDGAARCRSAAREQAKRGANVISFYNTGSLLDDKVVAQTMTDAEMQAVVETAHNMGLPAIADGHNAAGLNAALRAGADALVSATWPDETTWELLSKTGAYFVSHIYAFEASVGDSEATLSEGTMGWLPRSMKLRLLEIKREPYAAEKAIQKGIPMALGSDTGVIHHGDNAHDLIAFVEHGMEPMRALKTGTVNGAKLLKMEDRIGTLEQGKFADIVATSSNPLEHIEQLADIAFVMKGGTVFRAP